MRKGQKTQKKPEFRLKNKENRQKAGLKSCFGALIGTNGTNWLFWVVGRDVGFRSPNRDCPDEIGTVGKYVWPDVSSFTCSLASHPRESSLHIHLLSVSAIHLPLQIMWLGLGSLLWFFQIQLLYLIATWCQNRDSSISFSTTPSAIGTSRSQCSGKLEENCVCLDGVRIGDRPNRQGRQGPSGDLVDHH